MIRENTICHSGMRAGSLPSRPTEVFGSLARFVVLEFFRVHNEKRREKRHHRKFDLHFAIIQNNKEKRRL